MIMMFCTLHLNKWAPFSPLRPVSSVRDAFSSSISCPRLLQHLHTFSRSELRELPDDILQLLLEKCIEHGTLRADNIKCFVVRL